jgi:hypothetical protein
LCIFLLATAAQAAEVKVLSPADGATSTPALITVTGMLDEGEEGKFLGTLGTIRSAIVFLESPGGPLGVAISLGLTIRKRGLETGVADGAICTSACALAWLGGSPRRMGRHAHIGFHEPWDPSNRESSLKGDAAIANYIRQLGLPYAALSLLLRAGPSSMAWMTEASSSAYRIHYVELRSDQAERFREVLRTRFWLDAWVQLPGYPLQDHSSLALHGEGIDQLERGNAFATRLLFEQAAKAGLAQSAVALGATYDPNELGKLNVVGFVPYVEAARIWYEKAQVLGAVEAPELLRRLWASSQRSNDRFVAVLTSKKSRVDALNAFVELQHRYPAVLADRAPDVQGSNLGEKDISYRAVVGPSSREAASSVCTNS